MNTLGILLSIFIKYIFFENKLFFKISTKLKTTNNFNVSLPILYYPSALVQN